MNPLFFIVFLLPFLATSQINRENNNKETDPNKMDIDKNIFRVIMSLSTDTKFALNGSYEREIKKPVTIVLKAGPAFNREYDSTDAFGTEQYRWFLNAIASAELRYYFNLNRRIKLQKTVKNFSACYISLEDLLRSKPFIAINYPGDKTLPGSNRIYINIGYQKQFKLTCYSIFFGARLPGKVYANTTDVFDWLHGGISIGRVF